MVYPNSLPEGAFGIQSSPRRSYVTQYSIIPVALSLASSFRKEKPSPIPLVGKSQDHPFSTVPCGNPGAKMEDRTNHIFMEKAPAFLHLLLKNATQIC